MKNTKSLSRKSHLMGTKIRNLRKRNNLTMEDLSARCIRVNAEIAPSVSYLSMIERGKRVPSEDMLTVIASVFQKPMDWFLDDIPEEKAITPIKGSRGGISGIALEPSFLFSNEILQIAIPEMLSQTGTSGRQFAHLLIRAHQEHHQNRSRTSR
jgi:transcriptional regulator with XRE-family HTH domain